MGSPHSWIPLLPLAAAAVVDLRSREIPDWIPVSLLAWGVFRAAAGWSHGWVALVMGFAAGTVLALGLFRFAGFGGGDVKLVAALGAASGWPEYLHLLYYTALAGGLMALAAALRGRRDLAYAPAFLVGFVAVLVTHP